MSSSIIEKNHYITSFDIENLVKSYNDPKLTDQPLVYQIWNDGEITIQKGGPLLWIQTLQSMYPELTIKNKLNLVYKKHENSYAFVTIIQAEEIRSITIKYNEQKEINQEIIDDELKEYDNGVLKFILLTNGQLIVEDNGNREEVYPALQNLNTASKSYNLFFKDAKRIRGYMMELIRNKIG